MMIKYAKRLLILIAFSQSLNALPEDKTKPLVVHADYASFSEKTGQIDYKGHLALTQGTIRLTCDRATIQQNNAHQLSWAVAFGNKKQQAHYSEEIEKTKPRLHAFADEIRYDMKNHRITLKHHAKLIQGDESLSSPLIVYDLAQKKLITYSNHQEKTKIFLKTVKMP